MNETVLPFLVIVPSGALLIYTFATRANPFGSQIRGVQVFYVRLSFLQRVLVLRWYVLGILAINAIPAVPGLDDLNTSQFGIYSFLILLGTLVLLLLPIRYYFFEEGLAIGAGGLMQWSKFDSYNYTSAGVRLSPAGGGRAVTLYLTDVQRRALHATLERYLGQGRPDHRRTRANPRRD